MMPCKKRRTNSTWREVQTVQDRFIEPTILKNMNEKMDIMNEEVFGPVDFITYLQRTDWRL